MRNWLSLKYQGFGRSARRYIKWRVPVHVGENILNPAITGVYPIYAEMRNIIPEPGEDLWTTST